MIAHVGCSGWFYRHWRGVFYPEALPLHRWFEHYSSRFETVELNAPFYRWPQPSTVKGWRRKAPAGFRYSVKVNRQITHLRQLQGTAQLIREFYGIAEVLGPSMGCFLFQLPPRYHYSAERLANLIAQLDPAHRNVVEFRDVSWWRDDVYKAFEAAGLIFCTVSGPGLPDDLIKTGDVVYVRFHGRTGWYSGNYSDEELAAWSRRLKGSGAREVWVYFNNDRNGHAIGNALELIRQLRPGSVRPARRAPQPARPASGGSGHRG